MNSLRKKDLPSIWVPIKLYIIKVNEKQNISTIALEGAISTLL